MVHFLIVVLFVVTLAAKYSLEYNYFNRVIWVPADDNGYHFGHHCPWRVSNFVKIQRWMGIN
jgi:hypothetical protein